jgi:hypothetical protein
MYKLTYEDSVSFDGRLRQLMSKSLSERDVVQREREKKGARRFYVLTA